MQNFKPYKITMSKPHLKVSRPLLELNACTICNTQVDNTKHCEHCTKRILNFNQKLNTIKQTHENTHSNNTIITDNYSDHSTHNTEL